MNNDEIGIELLELNGGYDCLLFRIVYAIEIAFVNSDWKIAKSFFFLGEKKNNFSRDML